LSLAADTIFNSNIRCFAPGDFGERGWQAAFVLEKTLSAIARKAASERPATVSI
jgi:hypothetical protein